jgi:hypothetical protein
LEITDCLMRVVPRRLVLRPFEDEGFFVFREVEMESKIR